jgi:hypothetical protein
MFQMRNGCLRCKVDVVPDEVLAFEDDLGHIDSAGAHGLETAESPRGFAVGGNSRF